VIRCANCGRVLGEHDAQGVQFDWWSNGVGDLYSFCEECARREFARGSALSAEAFSFVVAATG